MKQYEKVDWEMWNQFDKLQKIVWTDCTTDIPCGGDAIGCATDDAVYSLYFNDPRFDSFVISMEFAHFWLGDWCIDHRIDNAFRISNDVIHYFANVMADPYCNWKNVGYGSIWSLLGLGRGHIQVPIFFYNMPLAVEKMDWVMDEIKAGRAPTGPNEYWTTIGYTPASQQILKWLRHYETGHEHGQ